MAFDKLKLNKHIMKRLEIEMKGGGITFREVPEWWQLDYIVDYLNKNFSDNWINWKIHEIK